MDVIENHEFLLLAVDDVTSLLACDELNVPSEETIFRALVTWAGHDPAGRRGHLARLLGHVKLPLLTPQVSRPFGGLRGPGSGPPLNL